MPKVYKSQLIEVIQTGVAGGNTATKLQFPDFPYLRNKMIYGIEIITDADMLKSPTGKAIAGILQLQYTYLTLYLDDRAAGPKNVGEWIQNVPSALLHRVQNADQSPFVRQMYELTGQIVYWEKCYFNFAQSLANTSDISFCLNVYFK